MYTNNQPMPDSPLSQFHPLVRAWFAGRFDAPTDAQAQGWPAIAEGRHTLVAAPTGSGKTLAAFLTCLDALVRSALNGGLPERTRIVYVSPLKALANDIQRNLVEPLAEINALAEEAGTPLPEIRVGVRTGDTPARERAKMAKTPPHILITTPESLYLLLTSQSGRAGLREADTLILDELHAVADDKRGSHLSLTVERLCALAVGPITRIGLSATQRPITDMARLLVGARHTAIDGTPECTIVDAGHARKMDLALEMPEDELGPIATHDLWSHTLDRIAELVNQHGTTLLFVNTRRLVERLAFQLSDRLGEDSVVLHHGSLAQKVRHETERRLKEGTVKLCVATSSLELGIDIGGIDLVCQVGSPRSMSLLLQRVGRSGHTIGETPKGRLFPLTRDELIESIALIRGIRSGNLDTLEIPPWPLDVLAQQIVAECASKEWDEDALFDLMRLAHPYRDLPRQRYDDVIEMLSRGTSPRQGRTFAYLHHDAVNRKVKGRRGARLAALTSGGAIPENDDYRVIVEPENTFVGTVNEDFAVESQRGDIFSLGNSSWKIRGISKGNLRVEDAGGAPPSIPFWLGEALGRTVELSDEVSDLRDELYSRVESGSGVRWLVNQSFPLAAAEQACAYIEEGIRVLGTVPTKKRIVAERFFDETGGMQLIIHSPLGSKINRAWGMALRKKICRTFDFELQAAATDDGILFSLGPSMSFPVADTFRYIRSDTAVEVLTQAVLQAPLFRIRWRWDASRALSLLRFSGGKRVPPPIQRMRSDDLLAAVFPAQVACQDNAMPGDVEIPDHPLVFETMRDCLHEAMDVDGLADLLAQIESGEIEVLGRDTTQPSVFSHQILNSMPYSFLDEDGEIQERRSRAVALRRALPENQRDLGALDPAAIANAARDAWPLVRDADELHDALLTLGLIPDSDIRHGDAGIDANASEDWIRELVAARRAIHATYGDDHTAVVASETAPLVAAAFPDVKFDPEPPMLTTNGSPPDQGEAELTLVRSRTECIGPFTPKSLAEALGMKQGAVDIALANLEGTGNVMRGTFTPGADIEEFCDRRILARINRDTIGRLRREIEPVPAAAFMRFLLQWQHVSPEAMLRGDGGLLDVVEQLQGFEAGAAAWESEILPARVAGYRPIMLDELCLSGEVAWGRFSRQSTGPDEQVPRSTMTRSGPISLGLREALPWLLQPVPGNGDQPPGAPGEILAYLADHGASFLPDIIAGTRRLPSDVEGALWQLVAAGRITADGFGGLRNLTNGTAKRAQRESRYRRRPRKRHPSSRWSLLEAAPPQDGGVGERAVQLLHRYGIIFPEVLGREAATPRWRELLQIYRRAEARGEIRGGRFVSSFVGEQFALPEAVELLRKTNRTEPDGRLVALSACDPLNLAGILTPGPRVPAIHGNRVAYQNGVPIARLQSGEAHLNDGVTNIALSDIQGLLGADMPIVAEPHHNGKLARARS